MIGPGLDIRPYVIGLLDLWMMPIKLDPNWKGGDYYGAPEPTEGVAQSLKTITLTALHFGWAEKVHGYNWAAEGRNPADAMNNLFAIEDSLYKTGRSHAAATMRRTSSGWPRRTSSITWRRNNRGFGPSCGSKR